MSAAEEIKLPKNVTALIDGIEKLTVLELSQLVKALEEKFGVSAAVPMAAMPAAAGGAGPEQAAEEQTEFSVMLTGFGDKKLQVIKEIRSVTDMGLKEAKDFVEGTLPAPIKESVSKEEAESVKSKMEAAGATIEIK